MRISRHGAWHADAAPCMYEYAYAWHGKELNVNQHVLNYATTIIMGQWIQLLNMTMEALRVAAGAPNASCLNKNKKSG